MKFAIAGVFALMVLCVTNAETDSPSPTLASIIVGHAGGCAGTVVEDATCQDVSGLACASANCSGNGLCDNTPDDGVDNVVNSCKKRIGYPNVLAFECNTTSPGYGGDCDPFYTVLCQEEEVYKKAAGARCSAAADCVAPHGPLLVNCSTHTDMCGDCCDANGCAGG